MVNGFQIEDNLLIQYCGRGRRLGIPDGVVGEKWDPPKPQYSFTSTDDTPW
jgi:hypothetical protein